MAAGAAAILTGPYIAPFLACYFLADHPLSLLAMLLQMKNMQECPPVCIKKMCAEEAFRGGDFIATYFNREMYNCVIKGFEWGKVP